MCLAVRERSWFRAGTGSLLPSLTPANPSRAGPPLIPQFNSFSGYSAWSFTVWSGSLCPANFQRVESASFDQMKASRRRVSVEAPEKRNGTVNVLSR
jgi:hypothetical protein